MAWKMKENPVICGKLMRQKMVGKKEKIKRQVRKDKFGISHGNMQWEIVI